MKLPIILCSILMVGCTTTREVRVPVEVEVKVPFYIPCDVSEPPEPILYTETLNQSDDLYDKVKAIIAENMELKAYTTRLRAVVEACKTKSVTK